MTWTKVSKPTGENWTNVNSDGKTQYDQSDTQYDQSDVYYDGINPFQWTNVNNPLYSLTWNQLPIAWQNYNSPWGSPTWTNVNKPQ